MLAWPRIFSYTSNSIPMGSLYFQSMNGKELLAAEGVNGHWVLLGSEQKQQALHISRSWDKLDNQKYFKITMIILKVPYNGISSVILWLANQLAWNWWIRYHPFFLNC